MLSWALLLLSLAFSASPFSTTPPSSSSHVKNSRTLFPFQEDGVARLVSDRRLLLADDMGLGKTVQSIVAMNRLFENEEVSPLDCRIMIICPKSVVSVWLDELERWIDERYFSIDDSLHVVSAGKTEPLDVESSRGTIQIINYDICHKYRDILQERSFDILICDEAHYLKSAQSQRSDAILGVEDGNGIQARYLWFLTGTPMLNRPNEIYPLLWALNERRWKSYNAFKNKWGASFEEMNNLGELKKLMRPLMLRRKKVDVLNDLPPKLYSVVSLDGSDEAMQKEVQFAFDNFKVDLSGARKERAGSSSDSEESLGAFGEGATLRNYGIHMNMPGNQALRALASIRSYTSSLKVQPAVELLKQYTMCEKVVVFAHHRKVILELKRVFGDSCVHIIGGMDMETRAEAVKRFQHDASCRLFIGSIRAAGVGLTLTASSHVVFLELDWSPGIMAQAEDRCHRVGQRDSVQVDYFVFKGTIDGWMARQLARKSQGIRRTLTQSSRKSSTHRNCYKLDFGKYKGQTVDDIPFDYLNNFLVKEDVYKKKPALWNALYLSDVIDEAPLNLMMEDDNDDAIGVAYTFDFGAYYGMEWSQVPQSYRDWIVETKGVWQKRKGLWISLFEGGMVLDEPELLDSDDGAQRSSEQPKQNIPEIDWEKLSSVDYIFDFGKFTGSHWCDVNEGYQDWTIKTKDIWLKRKDLWIALYNAGIVEEKPQ
ncbi:hypothetical protein ACHAXR_005990 [Thalassiosira sp. AJA248-18]